MEIKHSYTDCEYGVSNDQINVKATTRGDSLADLFQIHQNEKERNWLARDRVADGSAVKWCVQTFILNSPIF